MVLPSLLVGSVKALVGASPRWLGTAPSDAQRIYFANHSSHLDAVALWSALPPRSRRRTRPVAAADYWSNGAVRRYVANRVLRAVLLDRVRKEFRADPLEPLEQALSHGDSLILFPEGTRRVQAVPSPFKGGLYHLAKRFPDVELIPVYLENLHRCMPKGAVLPVPLVCTVRFGAPLERINGEAKAEFLERARSAVMELA